jgi:hypothetical protein
MSDERFITAISNMRLLVFNSAVTGIYIIEYILILHGAGSARA